MSDNGRKVRLVDTDVERPQLTAAIDEALLESRLSESCPDTIHMYRRRPASVSIGYFQASASVVDLEVCNRDGVPVVRRVSGGGAIYTDEAQLVYALVHSPARTMPAREGFALACGAVVRALRRMGVDDARVSGVNDVLAGDAKVSGSAQALRKGVHLVHGTVLVNPDLEAMFKYLRPQPAKLRAQGLPVSKERVTTLAKVLDHIPPMEEVKRVLAAELASAIGCTVQSGGLTTFERDAALRLEAEKYTRDEWNLMR
jgi:lipoate-protein ligase A